MVEWSKSRDSLTDKVEAARGAECAGDTKCIEFHSWEMRHIPPPRRTLLDNMVCSGGCVRGLVINR